MANEEIMACDLLKNSGDEITKSETWRMYTWNLEYDLQTSQLTSKLYRDVKEDKNSPYLKNLKHAEALIAKYGAPSEVEITTAQCREY